MCDYAIRFCTLAAQSGWNDTALYDVFLKGPAAPIQDLFIPLDLPDDIDALIALAIRMDNWLSGGPAAAGRTTRPSASSWPTTHRSLPDLEALIDSGADESLMDWSLARRLGLKSEPLAKPIRARSLNGKELFIITHISEPVQMIIDCHQEYICPYLHPLIL